MRIKWNYWQDVKIDEFDSQPQSQPIQTEGNDLKLDDSERNMDVTELPKYETPKIRLLISPTVYIWSLT